MAIDWMTEWQDKTTLESDWGGAVADAIMIMDDWKSIFTPFRHYAYKNKEKIDSFFNDLGSYFPMLNKQLANWPND